MTDSFWELCRQLSVSVNHGQTIVIATGLVLGILVAGLYRTATRGKRYKSRDDNSG